MHVARILLCLITAVVPSGVFDEKLPDLHHVGGNFDHLVQGGQYGAGKRTIIWTRRERNGPNDPWTRSGNTYSTRYDLVAVASRLAGDEIYLAGILPDERSVIERWKFPKKKGRWVYTMTNPAPPIGTPAGTWSASFSLHGQTLQMAALPPVWYAPDISVIMESNSHGFIRSIDVDPEGRFLLFSRYPEGDIYSIDLSQSTPSPTLLFSSTQHPELAALGELTIAQHEALGRVCVAEPADCGRASYLPTPPPVLLLIDSNNDGVFESTQVVPLEDYLETRELDATNHCVWSRPWRDS